MKKAKFVKTPWGKSELIMTSTKVGKKWKTKIHMGEERYKHLTNLDRSYENEKM